MLPSLGARVPHPPHHRRASQGGGHKWLFVAAPFSLKIICCFQNICNCCFQGKEARWKLSQQFQRDKPAGPQAGSGVCGVSSGWNCLFSQSPEPLAAAMAQGRGDLQWAFPATLPTRCPKAMCVSKVIILTEAPEPQPWDPEGHVCSAPWFVHEGMRRLAWSIYGDIGTENVEVESKFGPVSSGSRDVSGWSHGAGGGGSWGPCYSGSCSPRWPGANTIGKAFASSRSFGKQERKRNTWKM